MINLSNSLNKDLGDQWILPSCRCGCIEPRWLGRCCNSVKKVNEFRIKKKDKVDKVVVVVVRMQQILMGLHNLIKEKVESLTSGKVLNIKCILWLVMVSLITGVNDFGDG